MLPSHFDSFGAEVAAVAAAEVGVEGQAPGSGIGCCSPSGGGGRKLAVICPRFFFLFRYGAGGVLHGRPRTLGVSVGGWRIPITKLIEIWLRTSFAWWGWR